MLGVGKYHADFEDFEDKSQELKNKITESLFIDDRIINQHIRFPTLTENIRLRRQEKVNIQVPIYKDVKTDYSQTV